MFKITILARRSEHNVETYPNLPNPDQTSIRTDNHTGRMASVVIFLRICNRYISSPFSDICLPGNSAPDITLQGWYTIENPRRLHVCLPRHGTYSLIRLSLPNTQLFETSAQVPACYHTRSITVCDPKVRVIAHECHRTTKPSYYWRSLIPQHASKRFKLSEYQSTPHPALTAFRFRFHAYKFSLDSGSKSSCCWPDLGVWICKESSIQVKIWCIVLLKDLFSYRIHNKQKQHSLSLWDSIRRAW